jgi:hypothetical protein
LGFYSGGITMDITNSKILEIASKNKKKKGKAGTVGAFNYNEKIDTYNMIIDLARDMKKIIYKLNAKEIL